jgi:hypothetical protein
MNTFRRRPIRGLIVGFVIGAAVGVAAHVRSHVVENRMDGIWTLALHVLGDLGLSAVGAALALGASIGWVQALVLRSPQRRSLLDP